MKYLRTNNDFLRIFLVSATRHYQIVVLRIKINKSVSNVKFTARSPHDQMPITGLPLYTVTQLL